MKRFLSTTLFVIALLALASMAALARNGLAVPTATVLGQAASNADASTDQETQSVVGILPDAAAAASNKYNDIALPLDVQANWTVVGIPFTAAGLAQFIGATSVVQVLHWSATSQRYDSWFPGSNYGFVDGLFTTVPYTLKTGELYRILLNSANSSLNMISFVGNVPPENTIRFTLSGASSCKYNDISIPLERTAITNAQLLVTSLGGSTHVTQVLRWNSSLQIYDSWFPSSGYGFVNGLFTTTPFDVKIGYPYRLCLNTGANNVTWP